MRTNGVLGRHPAGGGTHAPTSLAPAAALPDRDMRHHLVEGAVVGPALRELPHEREGQLPEWFGRFGLQVEDVVAEPSRLFEDVIERGVRPDQALERGDARGIEAGGVQEGNEQGDMRRHTLAPRRIETPTERFDHPVRVMRRDEEDPDWSGAHGTPALSRPEGVAVVAPSSSVALSRYTRSRQPAGRSSP